MACGTKREATYSSVVFSNGTSTSIVVPVSEAFAVDSVAQVALAFEVQARTANLTLQAAIQYSDDQVTWDSGATAIGATVSATGWFYRGMNSTDSTRQFGRIVFLVSSSSGSQPDQAAVMLNIRIRS